MEDDSLSLALIRLSGYLPIESFLLDRRVDSLHLQKDDPRAIHLRKVLRAKTGMKSTLQ